MVVPAVSRFATQQSLLEARAAIAKQLDMLTNQSIELIVFAGTTPDPASVHWEDFGRVWADLLGLSNRIRTEDLPDCPEELRFRRIPKYMLSADNPEWAAHELKAAVTAMTCPVHANGSFFEGH